MKLELLYLLEFSIATYNRTFEHPPSFFVKFLFTERLTFLCGEFSSEYQQVKCDLSG